MAMTTEEERILQFGLLLLRSNPARSSKSYRDLWLEAWDIERIRAETMAALKNKNPADGH